MSEGLDNWGMNCDKLVAHPFPVVPRAPELLVICTHRDAVDIGDNIFETNPPDFGDLVVPEFTGKYEKRIWIELYPFNGVGEHEQGEHLQLFAVSTDELIRLYHHLADRLGEECPKLVIGQEHGLAVLDALKSNYAWRVAGHD